MKIINILTQAGIILCLCACQKEELPEILSRRTIIVYMAADNDLSEDAWSDVMEMQSGFEEKGVNLVVFIDPADDVPQILRIHHGGSGRVKNYPELNSADAAQMGKIISDMVGMYPADHYGLILWSHGTSWLPAGSKLKSFGEDNGRQTDIPALAEALPIRFDFVLFDACLMGAVEVAYGLKDNTDYMIASSTETIYEGFPYDRIIPELIRPNPDLKKVAESYFRFYDDLSGVFRSATVTLVNMKELDKLAEITGRLLSEQLFDVNTFARNSVQRLDVYDEQYVFDFFDFMNRAFPDVDKQSLIEQLNKTVLYKANTPTFIGQYEIKNYCGLSCYIPYPQRDDLNAFYQQFGWCAASGFTKLFK